MPRQTNRLTDKTIRALSEPGMHADGNGLYLSITATGVRSWVYRFRLAGRRRDMGLGALADLKLAEARTAADRARRMVRRGDDPIEARKAAQRAAGPSAEATDVPTLGEFATMYIDAKAPGWRGRETEKSWRRSFGSYAAPIARKSIDQIDTDDVLQVLRPLWSARAESAAKLRERIEEVLDAAKAKGLRDGENPARWRGHLIHHLPKRRKLQRGHHPALPYEQVPAFMAALVKLKGAGARALEWTLLTIARETMTTEAARAEVNRKTKVWTIPGARMKMEKDFRVPLSAPALAVLDKMMLDDTEGDLIFPGAKDGRPLANSTMDKVMRKIAPGYVPHGLRSTFRDWAGDETDFPRELAEEALAHTIGDEKERAYRRRDALERRRKLMDAWGAYCVSGLPSPTDVPQSPPEPTP